MVSGLLAAIGGGLQGWGEAEKAKAIRDAEQTKAIALATLNNQFQAGLLQQQISSNEKISGADITSREKLTDATLKQTAANEKAQRELQERVTKMELGSREKIASEGNAASLEIANRQIAGAKSLAEFQAGADQKLHSSLTLVTDETTGTSTYKLMTPDGKEIPKLKGPNGKEYDWAGPDTTTDASKNYNFMIANGFNPKQAATWAFGAKSSDRAAIAANLLQSMNSASMMAPNAENQKLRQQLAIEGADAVIAGAEASDEAATTVPAAAPGAAAAPASSTAPALPLPMVDGRPDTSKMVSGQRYLNPTTGRSGTWDASKQQMIPDE